MSELTPHPDSRAGDRDSADAATPTRLLDAAEELFAQKGYAATSVREITQGAECNLAGVNYHFGGKQKLYLAVYRRLLGHLRDYRLQGLERVAEDPNATLESLLRTFSRVFLQPLVVEGRGWRIMRLFLWEMLEPRLPDGLIFTEMVEPIFRALSQALTTHCPHLGETEQRLCLHSLVGQLVHTLHMKRMYQQEGETTVADLDIEAVLDHIVAFSAIGFRETARRNDPPQAPDSTP